MEQSTEGLKIAVVGGGIAGITTAYLLAQKHQVILFEKNEYLGGHTNTRMVRDDLGVEIAVDTGFIVCNRINYPNFFKLMDLWGVNLQDSEMTFGMYCQRSNLNYVGPSLREFLVTWPNLLKPEFLSFCLEQSRFNRQMSSDLKSNALEGLSLGDYLAKRKASRYLIDNYLGPVIGAIWSGPDTSILDFPAPVLARFFDNHGMLDFSRRPLWKTIAGGSHTYIQAFKKHYRGEIRLSTAVKSVRRNGAGCTVTHGLGQETSAKEESFDKVVFASHADQTLKMLSDPKQHEGEALGKWHYNLNPAVLHTDRALLPPKKKTWASWNYYRSANKSPQDAVPITYYMNKLQQLQLKTKTDFFVTLNRAHDIRPELIQYKVNYSHPVMTATSISTQKQLRELNGLNSTYFCGAYMGYGFHEDGVNSALEVCKHFGLTL